MLTVVADSEHTERDRTVAILRHISLQHGLGIHVLVASSFGELLRTVWHRQSCRLIILDVDLPSGGINVAATLRHEGYRGLLVFTAHDRASALAAYTVGSLNYVLKDDDFALGLERTLLFATALERIFMAHRVITCTDATHRRIPIDEVRYFTASHHGSICHFGSPLQEGPLRLTLEEVSSKFDERRFVRCHKSYVVNLSYVVSGSSNRLVLDDGSVLPVGRVYRKQVRRSLAGGQL